MRGVASPTREAIAPQATKGASGMDVTVGVIGAMDIEVDLLKEAMGEATVTTVAGLAFFEGRLEGAHAVVARCGVGKVNAALCAQALVDRFGATHLVNTGVAGSLDASIDIGDLVVSTDCVQHDFDVSALGYAPGVIPDQEVSCFPADAALRSAAARAAAVVASEVRVWEGRVASGDQFVGDAASNLRVAEAFGARCCEMEGAAIAQVAYANGVPFVVIRAISDKADGSAEQDYPSFARDAARRSAAIVGRMLRDLA